MTRKPSLSTIVYSITAVIVLFGIGVMFLAGHSGL